ncbi:MAG: hypothetical protein A2Y95_07515 [Deltaproteobacteria bacterium RBG_13_65_10]|nr:MAG: hypothetical protein A2Y95_07515 [Deltaproteobacteria bacterium RBG_13_65_10]
MRIEFKLELERIETPYFSIETSEGINKIFTLAATVMNVLETKTSVCITFHGGNAQDPVRKAKTLEQIIESGRQADRRYVYEPMRSGTIDNTYHLWLLIRRV